MCTASPDNNDLEGFAQFVGLSGTDIDLFYEAYYGMDTDIWEDVELEPTPKSYKS